MNKSSIQHFLIFIFLVHVNTPLHAEELLVPHAPLRTFLNTLLKPSYKWVHAFSNSQAPQKTFTGILGVSLAAKSITEKLHEPDNLAVHLDENTQLTSDRDKHLKSRHLEQYNHKLHQQLKKSEEAGRLSTQGYQGLALQNALEKEFQNSPLSGESNQEQDSFVDTPGLPEGIQGPGMWVAPSQGPSISPGGYLEEAELRQLALSAPLRTWVHDQQLMDEAIEDLWKRVMERIAYISAPLLKPAHTAQPVQQQNTATHASAGEASPQTQGSKALTFTHGWEPRVLPPSNAHVQTFNEYIFSTIDWFTHEEMLKMLNTLKGSGWRLPTIDELQLIYKDMKELKKSQISEYSFRSSEYKESKNLRVIFEERKARTQTCSDTHPLPLLLVRLSK